MDMHEDEERNEAVLMGLACLQKEHHQAIKQCNTAYLVVLIEAFRMVSPEEPL